MSQENEKKLNKENSFSAHKIDDATNIGHFHKESHMRKRKVMSRIEWIAQIQDIYCGLIIDFNREYFAKEIVLERLRAGASVKKHPLFTLIIV